jgi:transposase-like protein
MPWREPSPMEQRVEFVREYATELFTMTELAAQYGISRKTGYKWVAEYEAHGALGLCDRSRRPHHSPHATEAALIETVLALRRRHPRWGATKLLAVAARRDPAAAWPSRATVCTHLKAHGLVAPARRRPPTPHAPRSPLVPVTAPNAVWTTDFKGEFRTGDGVYCYPLTLRDGFSRFVLRCDGLLSRTVAATHQRFARAFAQYGVPDRIRSDNGLPFASPGLAGLSSLSVWWIRLGIIPERIAPGHPEQKRIARAISSGVERRDRAAAGAKLRRPANTLSPVRPGIQRGAAPRSARQSAATSRGTSRRAVRCRNGSRRLTTPAIWNCGASVATARCHGVMRRCFLPPRWPVHMSRSKKSTTGSGRCISPRSHSLGTMNGSARFTRSRSQATVGAPPAPLAPRLTARTTRRMTRSVDQLLPMSLD